MNIKKLTEELNKVADPRCSWGNKRHKLVDILVIGFCTIVCGGEDFTYMENLGIEKQEWLRTFPELPNGKIPTEGKFIGSEQLERRNFDIEFHWVSLDAVEDIEVYPTNTAKLLGKLGEGVQHFVYKEDITPCS